MAVINDTVQFEMRYYSEDNVVFYEGEFGDCLYDILKGSVYVFKNYTSEGGKRLLAHLGPGDYFGELAILEAMPRNATIVAAQDDTVLRLIRAENFGPYAAQNPDKAFKIMQSMGMSYHKLSKKYEDACRVVGNMSENCRFKVKETDEQKELREKVLVDYEAIKKSEKTSS